MNNEKFVCHCNIKENAELICKILDADAAFETYKSCETCGNYFAANAAETCIGGEPDGIRSKEEKLLDDLEEYVTLKAAEAQKKLVEASDESDETRGMFRGEMYTYNDIVKWLANNWEE